MVNPKRVTLTAQNQKRLQKKETEPRREGSPEVERYSPLLRQTRNQERKNANKSLARGGQVDLEKTKCLQTEKEAYGNCASNDKNKLTKTGEILLNGKEGERPKAKLAGGCRENRGKKKVERDLPIEQGVDNRGQREGCAAGSKTKTQKGGPHQARTGGGGVLVSQEIWEKKAPRKTRNENTRPRYEEGDYKRIKKEGEKGNIWTT